MGEMFDPWAGGDGAVEGLVAKVEELERVELGWTGPSERRERAKSGSEASRVIAIDASAFYFFWIEGLLDWLRLHSSFALRACD